MASLEIPWENLSALSDEEIANIATVPRMKYMIIYFLLFYFNNIYIQYYLFLLFIIFLFLFFCN